MMDWKDYNPEDDTWVDDLGRKYIMNQANPDQPQWLDITEPCWFLSHQGKMHYIDWERIDLPTGLLHPLKAVVAEKMKNSAPGYLSAARNVLELFVELANPAWSDFGDVSAADFARVWSGLNDGYRSYFREMYRHMASLGIGGARADIVLEIKHWKSRKDTQVLRDVLQWHETRGALTSTEEKVLRDTLGSGGKFYESSKKHAIRIFGWLLLDTLKRPSQVLGIRKNGVREVKGSDGRSEWFVQIQPIKYQAGLPLRWWRISEPLAREIEVYSKRRSVAELQEKYDRLIVFDAPCLSEHGVVSGADAKAALSSYIVWRKAISPRTGKPLHVTPTRIRHTGATRLAFQGVSRDLIQEILEHDSPESAQAYIDAIGSEIIPAIEKAGRQMGNIFYELNRGFFQGRVTPCLDDKPPVVVPEFAPVPIIVGTCGRDTVKDGVCPKHPFLSCYDGCLNFFAWDNPDPHGKALRYFESEISRWEKSVEAAEREAKPHFIADKTLQSYQRAATAAKEVLTQIKGETP